MRLKANFSTETIEARRQWKTIRKGLENIINTNVELQTQRK